MFRFFSTVFLLLFHFNSFSENRGGLKLAEVTKNSALKSIDAEGVNNIKNFMNFILQKRFSFNEIRNYYKNIYFEMDANGNNNWADVTKSITQDTIGWTKDIIDEAIQKLGPPPTQFSVVAFGSMPRDEAGIYTDLEAAFILQEKSPQINAYFEKLADYIAASIYILGEHPDVGGKGYRLDEAGNSPIHPKFNHRFASKTELYKKVYEAVQVYNSVFENSLGMKLKQFSRPSPQEISNAKLSAKKEARLASSGLFPFEGTETYMQTPEFYKALILNQRPQTFYQTEAGLRDIKMHMSEEAAFQKMDSVAQDDVVRQIAQKLAMNEVSVKAFFPTMVRNTRLIYGSEELYKQFASGVKEALESPALNSKFSTRREEILANAMNIMIGFPEYDKDSAPALVNGIVAEKVDIKKHYYRLFEQILTNLGFKFGLSEQNGMFIADELYQMGILNEVAREEMKDALNFFMGLRLREQVILGQQSKGIYVDQVAFDDQMKEVSKKILEIKDALKAPIEEIEFFQRDVFIREDNLWHSFGNPDVSYPLPGRLNVKYNNKLKKQGIEYWVPNVFDKDSIMSLRFLGAFKGHTNCYLFDQTENRKVTPLAYSGSNDKTNYYGLFVWQKLYPVKSGHVYKVVFEKKDASSKEVTISGFGFNDVTALHPLQIQSMQIELGDLLDAQKTLQKMSPNASNPVLRPSDIDLLRTKYAPLTKKYFTAYKDFAGGNIKAFSDIE